MTDSLRILLVDDDADDQELFRDALEKIDSSIHFFGVQNGIHAFEYLEKCQQLPHFIFLDLNMPRMDGKEFLKKFSELKHLFHIPVVIYSTSKTKEDVEETQKLGASGFIKKPVVFNDICYEISNMINTILKTGKSTAPR